MSQFLPAHASTTKPSSYYKKSVSLESHFERSDGGPKLIFSLNKFCRVLKSPFNNSRSLTSNIGSALQKDTQTNRYVFAHIVQGNFQFYQANDRRANMELAKANRIDAFAINIGRDTTNAKQLSLAYEVAENVGFSLFLSIDMSYHNQKDSSRDVAQLFQAYSSRKSQFRYEGKPLVSTFSGEAPGAFLDNNPDYNAAWKSLKHKLGFPIYFSPGWTLTPSSNKPAADGLLSWDAWSSDSSTNENNRRALAAAEKQYAAPISPLFFKRLSGSEGDNYIHGSDGMLLLERYLQLALSPPAFIELLTWNDYGKSHYLRDPRPNANLPKAVVSAHDYVDGFPHEPLLEMLTFFNLFYKTGDLPKMKKSKAYMWYPPYPKDERASSDPSPKPKNSDQVQDKIYILLTIAAGRELEKISIYSGSKTGRANLKEYLSKSGDLLVKISMDFSPGQRQSLELFEKNGAQIENLVGIPIVEKP